jgi:hypothetical protein
MEEAVERLVGPGGVLPGLGAAAGQRDAGAKRAGVGGIRRD